MKRFFEQIKWVQKNIHTLSWRYIILMILLIGTAILTYGEIFAMQFLLNKLMSDSMSGISIYIVVYVTMLLVKLLYPSVVDYYALTKVNQPCISLFSNKMTNAFYSIPISQLKKRQNTVYIDAQTSNLSELSNSITGLMGGIVSVFQLIIAAIIFGTISLPLLIAVSVLSLAYILIGRVFTTKLITARKEYMEQVSLLHQAIEEASTSSREVLSYNRMDWETKRRKRKFAEYYKSTIKMNNVGNIQYIVTNLLRWAIVLCILIGAAKLTLSGVISVALFVSIYRIFDIFIGSVESIYWNVSGISDFYVKLERIRNIIDDAQVVSGKNEITKINDIEFKNVKFSYGADKKHKVDVNLNFRVSCGQKIGIVGGSGNGKTTMLKLIAQMIEPDEGEILVNGSPLQSYSRVDWKKKVAICFQEPYFFADTIETNLLLGRNISSKQMISACKSALVHDTIMKLDSGYQTVLNDRGLSFSGGERQRLALARMLLADSDVFILDEVTSSVHPSLGWRLMESIDSVIHRPETIMLVVTHRLEMVQDADMIIVMEKGKISSIGTHEKLLRESKVYQSMISDLEGSTVEWIV